MTAILTVERVNDTFMACLFQNGEDTTNHIVAPGLQMRVGFHPGRIAENRDAIHEMLGELPDDFKTSGGGGYSFLNLCMDKHGNQWTGDHRTMEQLVTLGIAIGEVEYCLPRELWGAFPGGVPYLMVKA